MDNISLTLKAKSYASRHTDSSYTLAMCVEVCDRVRTGGFQVGFFSLGYLHVFKYNYHLFGSRAAP